MSRFDWKKYSRHYLIGAACVVIALSFLGGAWFAYGHRPAMEKVAEVLGQKPPQNLQNIDFSLFWDVWSRLEEKYVDASKIDRKNFVYGAAEGLVRSLKDPYTEFFPPAQAKAFREDIKGSFGGIGAEIGIRKGILTIISPLKNSPAERAGIKPGDKIFKINDTAALDLALDEAVRMIRGEKGTSVRLAILRDSFDTTKEFTITRDTIRIEVLSTEKKSDGTFIIKLHNFNENAANEFRTAVKEFYQSGSKKMILDVRNNPGGYLTVAVDIASWFMPAGDIVARERFADGTEELYRSGGYRLLEEIPLVVLINEGSASASEILAGALRDNRNIKLIGMKSFGKGSVQEVQELPGGASLKVTIAKWLTPNGTEINGKGLEPDINVEIKDEELKPGEDPMMEKGIEVLKGL